jgi:exonuclease VII large subunit
MSMPDSKIIKNSAKIPSGMQIKTRLAKGELISRVEESKKE